MEAVRLAVMFLTLFLCRCAYAGNAAAARVSDDLPPGVMRGPLLHEHSFQEPLVSDWWEEGVPHYMIGGSAVANERFLRLTTNDLDDHGFAFNTAPLDHDNWEARIRFSIRPPPPAAEMSGNSTGYQGGDGMAFWCLDQPIGDDHQHVAKYSKSISPELRDEMLDTENPWRVADFLLNGGDDDDDDDGGEVDEEDLTKQEKEERQRARERRVAKRRRREELFKRLFKRGTSIDASDREPRIMGVKFSDFNKGFGLILDSVGDEKMHLQVHQQQGDAVQHHHHTASIYLLLNLPNHTAGSGAAVVNNFDPTRDDFRQSPDVLRCTYDFRQKGTKPYDPKAHLMDEVTKAATAAEEPLELVVRYYKMKLTVIIRREDVAKREVSVVHDNGKAAGEVEVVRTYTETMCGEVYPVQLPPRYHFGLSASTGHRPVKDRKRRPLRSVFHEADKETFTHVDVHDVLRFELRELGLDARAMGYSKTIPLEHFDFEADKRERLHFSRQIPASPDSDTT
ncbi:hypothetical protein JKF63_07434 [Porcisia hertigi]|uniref:L-type lectin-like domain-containing protein n=1 Tax=Porcisia hertigi TaxID=2761500 RepID=A0A836YGB1_9TRYP|nr:hypothetical protein JKF63_07434 [Porcisia hertigi]